MDTLRKAKSRLSVGSWGGFTARSSIDERRSSRAPSVKQPEDPEDPADPDHGVGNGAHHGNGHGAGNGVTTTSLVELARIITREADKLEKYLRESGSPMPSFDADGPANFPPLPHDIKEAREEVVRAARDLQCLVTGPTESVRWMAWDVSLQDPVRVRS
jgi:hypothetical protein